MFKSPGSGLFNTHVGYVYRGGVAMLTHIEFETSVVIVLCGHFEIKSEGLPFGRQIDRCVLQIADPAGVRRRYADDAFTWLICTDIKGYPV